MDHCRDFFLNLIHRTYIAHKNQVHCSRYIARKRRAIEVSYDFITSNAIIASEITCNTRQTVVILARTPGRR